MKNAIMIVIGSALGILVFLFFGYIAFIIYINWPKDRTIAKNVLITPDWLEITIDPAVKPVKRAQYINVRIKDFKVDRRARGFDIKLADGTVVEPDVELYDEFGNKFEFHHSGFVMKTYDDIAFTPGPRKQFMTLPSDRKYTKLRIRGDIPFSCDQIYWLDYNPK